MEKTIHTAFLLCGLIGLLTGGICFSFAKGMLSLMNTKPELIDGAVLYLKIYAVGMPAMGIYNFGNGVMSASGDTKHPLMYLAFAGVINVILNLFFVIECHMAAEGVALASAISQYLLAFLILAHLMRRSKRCKFLRCSDRIGKCGSHQRRYHYFQCDVRFLYRLHQLYGAEPRRRAEKAGVKKLFY